MSFLNMLPEGTQTKRVSHLNLCSVAGLIKLCPSGDVSVHQSGRTYPCLTAGGSLVSAL